MTRRRTRTTHEGRQNAAAAPVLLPERLLPERAFFHVTGDATRIETFYMCVYFHYVRIQMCLYHLVVINAFV